MAAQFDVCRGLRNTVPFGMIFVGSAYPPFNFVGFPVHQRHGGTVFYYY